MRVEQPTDGLEIVLKSPRDGHGCWHRYPTWNIGYVNITNCICCWRWATVRLSSRAPRTVIRPEWRHRQLQPHHQRQPLTTINSCRLTVIVAFCPATYDRMRTATSTWRPPTTKIPTPMERLEREHSNGMASRSENSCKVQIFTKYRGEQRDHGTITTRHILSTKFNKFHSNNANVISAQ